MIRAPSRPIPGEVRQAFAAAVAALRALAEPGVALRLPAERDLSDWRAAAQMLCAAVVQLGLSPVPRAPASANAAEVRRFFQAVATLAGG